MCCKFLETFLFNYAQWQEILGDIIYNAAWLENSSLVAIPWFERRTKSDQVAKKELKMN